MNITELKLMKQRGHKISMVTCYDYWSAKIIDDSDIDCIIVGDSAAMVMHGHKSTIPATIKLMCSHIEAVVRGAPKKFIVGDMPFLSYRKCLIKTMTAVEQLMHAGAHAIKIEGINGNEQFIKHIVQSGIPVMGHLGLTPQSIYQLGGFRVQGKNNTSAQLILEQAQLFADAGCFALVLECVPAQLAKTITEQLSVPIIGIGAGMHVDGQVLVLQDLLGMNADFKPKFLKTYCDGFSIVQTALNQFNDEVKQRHFPASEHCYSQE